MPTLLLSLPHFLHRLWQLSHRPACVGMLFLVVACAGMEEEVPLLPLDEAFTEAQQLLDNKQWEFAAEKFRDIEANYPYSGLAATAQLLQSYAWYQAGDLGLTEVALSLFRTRYPSHPDNDWVLYMQGLLAFEQISPPNREQEQSTVARRYFVALVRDYPQSQFASDARLKITLIDNFHAGHQMEIGRLYQRLNAHIAAVSRFVLTIQTFDNTQQSPEALYRLSESYRALGLQGEANYVLLLLNRHYPESGWYALAFERWGAPDTSSLLSYQAGKAEDVFGVLMNDDVY
ncbi:MAG: outer membrane protein assembly factor BamD [Alphaproteobacteria bacterium]|nr:outer membrane protein assembly factor BamD [Alphaproteobacteria bacterium]